MCDFKPGDEVEKIKWDEDPGPKSLPKGTQATVAKITVLGRRIGLHLMQFADGGVGHDATNWRKVQRRDLSAWLKTSVGNTDKLDKRQKAGVRA